MHPRVPILFHSKRHPAFVCPLRCLPNEILGITFSLLHRHDLVSVVRVCRSFYTEGQRSLYRSVELTSEAPYVHETISLLETLQVGGYVREVALTTTSSHTAPYPPWFPPNIAQHWVGLRRLELCGVPFSTSQDVALFRSTLEARYRKLQVLAYRHDPAFAFPGVESVFLGERSGRREDQHIVDFGSANRSAYTLTHISFTGPVFHCVGSAFDTFVNLRFPNLKSLELGTLATSVDSVPYPTTIAAVTRFVVEHNTIEHLSLSKRVPRNPNDSFFHIDDPPLGVEVLPRMRSFEGCPATLTVLVRRGVSSVFSLTSLSLFASEENLNDVTAMVDAFKFKALTSVRNLRVEFPCVMVPPFVEDGVHAVPSNGELARQRFCMDQIAGMCPNVVNYSASFPPLCGPCLKSIFALYTRIETISLPWRTLLVYMESSQAGEKKYFAPLVESRPSLTTVIARQPRYTKLKDQVFTFVRDPMGELFKVIREDGRRTGSSF